MTIIPPTIKASSHRKVITHSLAAYPKTIMKFALSIVLALFAYATNAANLKQDAGLYWWKDLIYKFNLSLLFRKNHPKFSYILNNSKFTLAFYFQFYLLIDILCVIGEF